MNGETFKNFFRSYFLIGMIVFVPCAFGFYYLHKRQIALLNYLDLVLSQKDFSKKEDVGKDKFLVEKSKTKTWLDVQKKVKDTVVQIFTQVSKFNWSEPYKTPEQYEGAGSGFFIDKEGHLLTNFHVISQASAIEIQIPSFGRKRFYVEIVSVYPEKDIALLKLTSQALEEIKNLLGSVPFLPLGNSDVVLRSQEVLALGYPLGQERFKCTLGIVSGRERAGYIQITAPLNPGNSGGPSLNLSGEVIGINFAGVLSAQNVGYIIPINEVKSILDDMFRVKFLRRPVLGCIFTVATSDLVKYLGNPIHGGWYIAKVFENTILNRIGIKEDDMLYAVNGYKVDLYGELSVPWSEDKISLLDFLNRFAAGDEMHFVIYRKGKKLDFKFKLDDKYLPPIRKIYPEFEKAFTDYEVIGGMVVMQLTLNHVAMFLEHNPNMAKYLRPEVQHNPALVIAHILPDSQAKKAGVLGEGSIIEEVNGEKVSTLSSFRSAIKKSKKDGFLTIKTEDKMFAVLSVESILKEENRLSATYFYEKSDLLKDLEQ